MTGANALCSMLALGFALKSLQKRVCMHIRGRVHHKFSFLPLFGEITSYLDPDWNFDTAVLLNCPENPSREIAAVLQKPTLITINIDRCQTRTAFGDMQLIDPEASGTSELIYRVIKNLPIVIDHKIAMAINSIYRIKGVKMAVLIKERALGWTCLIDRRRSFHVSLYSEGDVNVADIATRYGGGGNTNTAGFMTTTTLFELKAQIVDFAKTIFDDRLNRQTAMYPDSVDDVIWPVMRRAEAG